MFYGEEIKMQDTDSTVERIEKVATKLFALKGYNGVSVREIFRVAKVGNNAALSYYFGGKKELYIGIVEKYFDLAQKNIEKIDRQNISSKEKIFMLVKTMADTHKETPYVTKLLFNEVNQPSDCFDRVQAKIFAMQESFRHIIRAGIERREFRADVDVNCLVMMIHGIVQMVFLVPKFSQDLISESSISLEEYLNKALEYFFYGIAMK